MILLRKLKYLLPSYRRAIERDMREEQKDNDLAP